MCDSHYSFTIHGRSNIKPINTQNSNIIIIIINVFKPLGGYNLSLPPSMFGRRFLFAGYIALFVLVLLSGNSHAKIKSRHCDPPSYCGNIQKITYPFRLKGDPENCGYKNYELACENNRTVLSLFSGKYYVEAINYNNNTIRLVDVGIQKDN